MKRFLLFTILSIGFITMAQTIPYRNSWAVGQSMDGPGRRGSIATGDFNDDGRLDFVVRGIEDVNNTTSPAIYYQQPDGSFSPVGVTFLSTSNDLHYRVVDFNKDGKDDIVESGYSHNLTIFIQGSNGSFTALDTGLNIRGSSYVIDDFNEDGTNDIFITSRATRLFYQNPNGTFTQSSDTFNNPTNNRFSSASVGSGDIDNDGDIDILISGGTFVTELSIFLRDGSGNYVESTHSIDIDMYSLGEVPVIIEDINNDGLSDILISAYESSQGWSTYLLLKDNSTTLSYDERKLNSTSGLYFC